MGNKAAKAKKTQSAKPYVPPPQVAQRTTCLVIGMESAKAPVLSALQGHSKDSGMAFKSIQLEAEEADSFMHGGRDSVRPMWRHLLFNVNCVICVVDASNRKELDMCKDEFHSILNSTEVLKTINALVVCTNASAKGAMTVLQVARELELDPTKTTLFKSNQQRGAQTALLSASLNKDSNVAGFTENQIFDPAMLPLVFDFVDETAAMAQYGKKGPEHSQFFVVPIDTPPDMAAATPTYVPLSVTRFFRDALKEGMRWLSEHAAKSRAEVDKKNNVKYVDDAEVQLHAVSVTPPVHNLVTAYPRKHHFKITGADVEENPIVSGLKRWGDMQRQFHQERLAEKQKEQEQQQEQPPSTKQADVVAVQTTAPVTVT